VKTVDGAFIEEDGTAWEQQEVRFPYRGCPVCLRSLSWEYSERDVAAFGLGSPSCPHHGFVKGWLVVDGTPLQSTFLTGGYVPAQKGWVNAAHS
jgi:hypothetical protein